MLISKCDTATPTAITATTDAVRRLRPDARIAEIFGGAIPASLLDSNDIAPASRLTADAPDHPFRSWSYPDTDTLDASRLREVLAALPPSVLRAKGIVRIGAEGMPHLLQLIGKRWTLEAWHGPSPPTGLVVIGTPELPQAAELAAMFTGTLMSG